MASANKKQKLNAIANCNSPKEAPFHSPEEFLNEIAGLDAEATNVPAGIRGML